MVTMSAQGRSMMEPSADRATEQELLAELYHGPAAAEELATGRRRPVAVVAAVLDRLTADDLVRPIQKTRTPAIFALTRKGERLLERLTLQRLGVRA